MKWHSVRKSTDPVLLAPVDTSVAGHLRRRWLVSRPLGGWAGWSA